MKEPKIHSLRASPIGRRAEFADFYTNTYPAVAAEHLALTGNPDLAHAAVSAAYVRAWRAWSAVRTLHRPVMWVRADAVRRIQRPRWVQRLAGQYPVRSAPLALDPEDELLVDALGHVVLTQRVPLVLHYVAQLPVHDIVDWFGGTVAEVDTLLDDGFEALVGLLDWPDDSARDAGRHSGAHFYAGTPFDWTAGALEDGAHRFRRYVPTPPSTEVFRGARVKKVTRRGSLVTAAAVVGSVGLVVYFSPAPPPAAEAAPLIPSGPVVPPAAGAAAPPVYQDTVMSRVAGTANADPSPDVAAGAALEKSIATSTGSPRSTGGGAPTTTGSAGATTSATTSPAASTTATSTTTTSTTATTTTTSTSTPETTTSTSTPVTTTTTTGRHRAVVPDTTTVTTPATTTATTPATTSSSAPSTTASTSETSDTSETSSSVTATTRPTHSHGHTSTTTTTTSAPGTDDSVEVGGTTGGAEPAAVDPAPVDPAAVDPAPVDVSPVAGASPTSTTVTIGQDRAPVRATGTVATEGAADG